MLTLFSDGILASKGSFNFFILNEFSLFVHYDGFILIKIWFATSYVKKLFCFKLMCIIGSI